MIQSFDWKCSLFYFFLLLFLIDNYFDQTLIFFWSNYTIFIAPIVFHSVFIDKKLLLIAAIVITLQQFEFISLYFFHFRTRSSIFSMFLISIFFYYQSIYSNVLSFIKAVSPFLKIIHPFIADTY